MQGGRIAADNVIVVPVRATALADVIGRLRELPTFRPSALAVTGRLSLRVWRREREGPYPQL